MTRVKSPKGGGIGARTADMEGHSTSLIWGYKDMKRLVIVIGGAAALALAGCNNNNQDAVNNAELNQPAAEDLNALANDAATNAEAPAVNAVEVNDQNAAAPDNGPNPSEAQEQNVDSM
jgi:hypothetical protein